MSRLAWLGAGLAAATLACASPPPPAPSGPTALVSVEVLSGFQPADVAPGEDDAPVVVLLDATGSMAAPTSVGPSHFVAAQRAATRFVAGVPRTRPLWFYAIGSGEGAECLPVSRGTRGASTASRSAMREEIGSLEVGGEGGLASALESVRSELERADQLPGSRVVVFSDLGAECGGDLCVAATGLVEGGAQLDVVAIGEAQAPACLREPAGLSEGLPPPRAEAEPVPVRLEVAEPEPMVAGCSEVGGLPIAAPPGRGTLVVGLDPPLRVDAYFAPGQKHVLQILDFPSLNPKARHWRWREVSPSGPESGP